jgi:hypothetical protein
MLQSDYIASSYKYCLGLTCVPPGTDQGLDKQQSESESRSSTLCSSSETIACRAALRESAFTEAVEEGRAMTIEQAIAYALDQ